MGNTKSYEVVGDRLEFATFKETNGNNLNIFPKELLSIYVVYGNSREEVETKLNKLCKRYGIPTLQYLDGTPYCGVITFKKVTFFKEYLITKYNTVFVDERNGSFKMSLFYPVF